MLFPAGIVLLAVLGAALSSIGESGDALLWPGAKFSSLDRSRAIERGVRFLHGISGDPTHFREWGHDLLWCFYSISATSLDAGIRRQAWIIGRDRAGQWRRDHPSLPPDADADDVANFAFGSYAADQFGVRDDDLKEQIRRAAARFTGRDFLGFDPAREPPPADVPKVCERCGASNARGGRVCQRCREPLHMQSPYDLWCDALITTYTGDRYGVMLGAHHADVIRWAPAMRPYPVHKNSKAPDFYPAVYAITHLVYTVNDYSLYRLSSTCFPQEFEFLKTTLQEALTAQDAETIGEYLDTLRSFGLTTADPTIRNGMEYLLSNQNPDGSWGDRNDRDVYGRYHPTWTAIDGLREYRWSRIVPCPF